MHYFREKWWDLNPKMLCGMLPQLSYVLITLKMNCPSEADIIGQRCKEAV